MNKDKPDYNSFFYYNPLPSWVYDQETFKILDVNQAAIHHYVYSKEEFLSLTLKDLMPEQEVPKLINSQADIQNKEGNIYIGIFTHQKKTGDLIQMEINGHKVDFNERQSILVVCQDVTEKIEQEEKILQSEQRFKALVQEGGDLIGILDAEGKYLYVSPTSISVLGIAPEEFIGRSPFEFIHPDDAEKVSLSLQKIATEKKVLINPFRFRNKNKEWRWIETVLTNMTDHPAVNGIVANSRDITEKIEQKEKFELSQKRFKSLVDNSMDCTIIISVEGKSSYVSASIKNMLGYTPGEAMEIDFRDLVHPEDLAGAEKALALTLEHPGVPMKGYTSRVRHKNGSWRWVEPVITNMLHDPSVGGIVDNFRDITEQVEAQKQLEANEQFNRTVLESSPDCLKVMDANGQLQYMNFNGLCQMEIDDFSKFKNKNWWTLWGTENEDLVKEAIRKALTGENAQFTAFCPTAKGTPKWWNVIVSPITIANQPIQQLISVSRDITEQKQKELEKELLGKISLDFSFENNLLTAANALCQTICDYGNFDFVELWLPTIENTQIQLFSHKYSSPNAATFYEWSKDIKSFANGEGLPGIVWDKKTTLLWKDIGEKDDFVRKEAAQKAAIKSAMGISLVFNEKIVGILVVATQFKLSYLKKYVKLFEEFEYFIGSEISRKRLEKDFQHLYDAIPDLICTTDLQGRFLKINKAGCDLIGRSEEEILYNTFEKFVHPDDKDSSHNDLEKLKKGGKTYGFENRYINKNGDIIWLSWTSNSSLQEGLIYATARNITEEKRLRELNRQVSKLAKIGSWEVNFANDEIIWSEMVHELHETDHKTFTPNLEGSIDFYREDFKELVRQNVEKCVSSGIPFDFEAVLVTAKKNERWIRAIGNAEIVDGKCQRIYGSFQDIHDRKESELRLKSISDDLPGVTFQYIITPKGKDYMQGVSKAATDIWNVSPEDCEQNNDLIWNQIKKGGDFEAVQQTIRESIEKKRKWNFQWRNILPSGEVRWHEGYGTPNILADGTIVFNSLIFDITEKYKAVVLYDEASKMARIGSWEVDLVNSTVFWSDMVHELHDTDPKNFVPDLETGINFYREDFRSMVNEEIAKCIETGEGFDFEAVIITAQKQECWVRAIGNAEMVNGKCQRIYGSFQDINLSKSLEIQNREILESISDAFYGLDKNWNIIYFNKEAENLLNRKSEDVLGKNLWEEFPPATGTEIEEKYRGVAKTGKTETFEYWYPGDGSWYEINAYPSKGGVSAFFKNIDDKRKAEEELIKAFEEKNKILESIGDAFFAVDKDWIVTYWNKEAEKVLGRKRADIIGQNLWDKYADAIDSDFYRQYHKAMDTGKIVDFEEYYPTLDKWFEVSAYPGEEGLSVYFKDVTLRKKADIRLLQANERFEKVTQATNDAIWDWDIETGDFFRSQGIEHFFGKNALKKLHTENFWEDKFFPEDLPDIRKSIDLALKDPAISRWEKEYRIIKEKGETGYVLDKGIIIRNSKGKAYRMVGAMTDISERKHHEVELLKLNQILKNHAHELEITNEQLEQFAFIASHDLQEPLRMISSFLDQLKRKYGGILDEKGHQYIYFATDGAKRMKQIILDLLEYSRAGKLLEPTEKVDINEIIEEYRLLRRKVIAEKSVSLTVSNLPVVQTYKAPLIQTLHCLIDNAIKYCKEGETPIVDISAEELNDCWKIRIEDNGIGIDPQFFDKIFIIFQRLHNRDQYDGTGIGLSIAKKHVESWGGKLWLESEPEKGSIFYFTIPKTQ